MKSWNTVWYRKQLETWVAIFEKVDLWLVDSSDMDDFREYKRNIVVACYDYP